MIGSDLSYKVHARDTAAISLNGIHSLSRKHRNLEEDSLLHFRRLTQIIAIIPYENSIKFYYKFFGGSNYLSRGASLGSPPVRCTRPMAKCLPLSHPPPDRMFPADESFCNSALPGALLVHLALGTIKVICPLGIPIFPPKVASLR